MGYTDWTSQHIYKLFGLVLMISDHSKNWLTKHDLFIKSFLLKTTWTRLVKTHFHPYHRSSDRKFWNNNFNIQKLGIHFAQKKEKHASAVQCSWDKSLPLSQLNFPRIGLMKKLEIGKKVWNNSTIKVSK